MIKLIADGLKTIEIRLDNKRTKNIQEGELIKFYNSSSKKSESKKSESTTQKVQKRYEFNNVREALLDVNVDSSKAIPNMASEAALKYYESTLGFEDGKVIVFHLEPVAIGIISLMGYL